MDLPKNITQIGETNRSCKIYVEDYVISYITQLNGHAIDKELAVSLYGVKKEEAGITYLFLYGAGKLNFLQRETRHLSQAVLQEAEKIRNKYLHINFDILQKIIDLKLINFTNKDNKKVILIENRKEDMILNEIYENKIIESFIISKANDNNLVNNICNESTYYFGIDDDYIKNLNVRKIQIENKLISYIDDEMKDKTLDYLCVWGMIV